MVIVLGVILAAVLTAVAGSQLAATLLALGWRRRPTATGDFTPRVSLIVPTWRLSPTMPDNFRRLLTQDYPDYEVLFCVQSADDAGVPVIETLLAEHPRGRVVVAGLATACSQQNHNMLAGVRAAGDVPEILAFGDNDLPFARDWLRQLVAPLADPAVAATSGYRWLAPPDAGFGAQLHTFLNLSMLVQFVAANRLFGYALWGGSFALRRTTFAELDTAACWATTLADDMPLVNLLADRGLRTVLTPACLTVTPEAISRPRATLAWLRRQTLILKAYQRGLWAGLMVPAAVGALALWLAPAVGLAVGGAVGERLFWAGVVYHAVDLFTVVLGTYLGPVGRPGLFMLRAPLFRVLQVLVFIGTLCGRAITWGDVRYSLGRRGRVTRLERL